MNPTHYDIPDDLWLMVEPLLPEEVARPQGGRPPVPNYRILCGIIYRLRTGCQWRAVPPRFGTGPTLHRRFQEWVERGIFTDIFNILVRYYDQLKGIDWHWMSMDGSISKALKSGEGTGRNPTDRGKMGVKRHVLADADGIAVAVTVTAANVNDNSVAAETLDSSLVRAGRGLRRPKHLCMDNGYDDQKVRAALKKRGIIAHIRRRREVPLLNKVKEKPRRWVVERTNS